MPGAAAALVPACACGSESDCAFAFACEVQLWLVVESLSYYICQYLTHSSACSVCRDTGAASACGKVSEVYPGQSSSSVQCLLLLAQLCTFCSESISDAGSIPGVASTVYGAAFASAAHASVWSRYCS